jgi:predicted DCC family thiol-disulfide oxidoreductase YuxK
VTPARATFVYDAECGFCTRFARWLVPRVAGRLDVVPAHLTGEDVRASSWYLGPDGARLARHAGIAAALDATDGPWRFAGRVLRARPLAPVAGVVYDWVARNRHRMPGGTPQCRLDEEP